MVQVNLKIELWFVSVPQLKPRGSPNAGREDSVCNCYAVVYAMLCCATEMIIPKRTALIHTAENIQQAQQCSPWHHRNWSSTTLRSPHLVDAVSLATLFAIRTCSTTDGTLQETSPTGFVFCRKGSKGRKAKEKEVTLSRNYNYLQCTITMCPPHRVIWWHCSKSTHLSLCCYVLCAQRQKFCYFYNSMKFY